MGKTHEMKSHKENKSKNKDVLPDGGKLGEGTTTTKRMLCWRSQSEREQGQTTSANNMS